MLPAHEGKLQYPSKWPLHESLKVLPWHTTVVKILLQPQRVLLTVSTASQSPSCSVISGQCFITNSWQMVTLIHWIGQKGLPAIMYQAKCYIWYTSKRKSWMFCCRLFAPQLEPGEPWRWCWPKHPCGQREAAAWHWCGPVQLLWVWWSQLMYLIPQVHYLRAQKKKDSSTDLLLVSWGWELRYIESSRLCSSAYFLNLRSCLHAASSGQWVRLLQTWELIRINVSWGILCESELHCREFWLLLWFSVCCCYISAKHSWAPW